MNKNYSKNDVPNLKCKTIENILIFFDEAVIVIFIAEKIVEIV